MRMGLFIAALVCAGAVSGQKRFNRQDYCFKNPASPVCPGHEDAIKPRRPEKKDAGPQSVTNVFSPAQRGGTPKVITVGGIDWRFADPFADALVGFNLSGLGSSPLARNLIARLAAQQGISEADLNKIFDGLSGVDQVALSFRDNRLVVMITGRATETALPPLEPGLKVAAVSADTMLVGHEDAVDQAMRRIAEKGPLLDLEKLAEERQSASEFWAIGSAGLVGSQAVGAGVKRFFLTVSIREKLTSDLALEFYRVPDANTLRTWKTTLGAATLEGNTLHVRTLMEAGDVEQKFTTIAASPVGQRLGTLLASARYLPARESPVPNRNKPVIYGLDGGPKEVNQ